ncbi:hypothetical protein [Lysobacter sp. CA199]|uniref:phage tail tube protein n=1 Tax=Lysobacter sp. CA199 TaxID=3455608 RepID=UPI003F8D2F8B
MSTPTLFSLQGYLMSAERLPNGKPGKTTWLGNVPEATLSLATESTPKTESFSGQRQQYGKMYTAKTGTLNITMDEWSTENWALGVWSTTVSIASGSVTSEVLPTGLIAGDKVVLDRPFASALVLTDSTPTTPAVVPPANYRLVGHSDRVIELLNPGTLIQPFKAAYTYAAATSLAFFKTRPPERYLIFDGINTETNEPVMFDFYRAQFEPFQEIGLIHAEYGSLQSSAALLFDPQANIDPILGGLGRMQEKAAT